MQRLSNQPTPATSRRGPVCRVASLTACFTAFMAIAPAGANVLQFAAASDPLYLRSIKPILKAKCYSCHGGLRQEANLRLDTARLAKKGGDSGAAIDPAEPLSSLLLERISAKSDEERMPPEGEPLSAEQIDQLRAWLKAGASAPANESPQPNPQTHWAFQSLPSPANGSPVVEGAIDGMIREALATRGILHTRPAQAIDLVRRMYLDLHGLPPTPAELKHWSSRISATREKDANANSELPVIRELVDHLLTSPRYGERWAQHWLDIVRYADTHGYEVNTPRPNAWPYRDYVIRAFNEDKPYNEFIIEQLAGDSKGEDAATGFLVAAAALLPGQIGKDEASKRLARQDALDEIVVGVSATFLGLTVGCARCHDHKFDPIPQSDYYSLQAFFAGVDYGERPMRSADPLARRKKEESLEREITELNSQLRPLEPLANRGQTIVIDDEDLNRVSLLAAKNGHGQNPAGAGRGYLDDVGAANRLSNISGGRYTWWTNKPGQDVFTWNPNAAGKFRVWISWGVHGSGVHTRDARYVLDLDGDLESKTDQTEIARADQYYFAGIRQGESEKKPLWSGLQDAGEHQLRAESRIILRCGETNTGITADVIVLQQGHEKRLPQLRAPVSPLSNLELFAPVAAKHVRFTSRATNENNRYEPCLDELEVFSANGDEVNLALAKTGAAATSSGNYSNSGKHQLKHINDGRYGNSFSWISNLKGQGWVQIELPQQATLGRIEWARDRNGQFKDRLPVDYKIEVSTDGQAWSTVASSADRTRQGTPFDGIQALLRGRSMVESVDNLQAKVKRLKDLKSQREQLLKPQMVFAGKFRKPSATFVLNRGDPEQPTNEATPQSLEVFQSVSRSSLPASSADQARRLALARWIAQRDNPLTARVMANRIWQYHFGVGLVETPSDFGLNGALPTHPKLLDWLADQLVRSGWSIKHLHRLIMASKTYQQSSVWRPETTSQVDPYVVDADCRLLWRFPSRRLEAEAIRDCILHVSGNLNLKTGGPGFDFFKSRGGLSGFPPVVKFNLEQRRRMIYAHKIRMERVPVFGAFDCPDAGLPAPRRSQSTTAIQALNLFNSSFVVEQAEQFSRRIEKDLASSRESRITRAFQLALGRNPTSQEHTAAQVVEKQHGLAAVCRALFNSSEFLYIP